jgi:rSAM/selenodomain-associated transferase 1
MRPAMILFAKAPVPGCVKTRLEPLLGRQRACEFHSAMVLDMLEKLSSFSDFADIELHTDIPTDAWAQPSVARKLQAAGDLGLKMFHALNQGLSRGRPQVLIAGSDAPTLPCSHLHRLLASTADVAFGPCEDGGYYAIACRGVHPAMFAGVGWSTSLALEQSERAAHGCGLTVERGEPWYDVDDPRDLVRLLQAPDLPRHTRLWRDRCGTIP